MTDDKLRYGTRKCYVLPVTRACNARCVFCATDVYDPKSGIEFMDIGRLSISHIIAHLFESGVTTFEITGGGEPTLHPAIEAICESLHVDGAEHIRLYTNGIRLIRLPRLAIDELCLSRCALDSEKNQQIMKLLGGSPDLIEQLSGFRRMGYDRIKLSVPLVRGGVESLDDATELVRRVSPLIDSVVFRPMYPATPRRDLLAADIEDAWQWQTALRDLESVVECKVEFDAEGCFRSAQLILAADGSLYSDWSLRQLLLVS